MRRLLVALLFGLLLLLSPKDSFAAVPGTVTGVLVEYPECVGDSCSYVQSSCSWNAISGATSYNYTITEVDTGTQIQTATVASTESRVVFPITQERTYKCDVFATNAEGSGGTGTHSLLCSANGLIDATATPTTPPAGSTATPLPTKPPIEAPGGFETTAIIIGGLTLLIIGGLALILF